MNPVRIRTAVEARDWEIVPEMAAQIIQEGIIESQIRKPANTVTVTPDPHVLGSIAVEPGGRR